MKLNRIAFWCLSGLFAAGFAAACTSVGDVLPNGEGICGNNIVEPGEECDDGNTVDDDGCTNICTLGAGAGAGGSSGSGGTCGDGKLDKGEACDDGNDDNEDECRNDCTVNDTLCNLDGIKDENEECDDGNTIPDDGCTNTCKLPVCGDGIVQEGEDCDDGKSELNSKCPDDCLLPDPTGGAGGGGGGSACDPKTFYGTVSNPNNPSAPGNGVPPVWSYGGLIGVPAGNAMCKAIGADHVCTYAEILKADQAGELGNLDKNITYWLHRTTEAQVENLTFKPGAGARCNDWTYPTDHISDGEWFEVYKSNSQFNSGGFQVGTLSFHLDQNPDYDGKPGKTCKSTSTKGCAGPCSSSQRAILCCNPSCD